MQPVIEIEDTLPSTPEKEEARQSMVFLDETDELYNLSAIDSALEKMALSIREDYHDKNPLVIGVMNGAVVTLGHLLPKFSFLLEVDYCHATRYGKETTGGAIDWLAYPNKSLKDRHVLLVDDIFDEGVTLKHITEFCKTQGASTVKTAVLLDKKHQRKVKSFTVDYVALPVDDRYVFGFGLDYKGHYRNAPGVYAIPEHLLS
jgi:hypoxanthine phosphoribosyltransferase